jgi:hypothetical protein
MSASAADQHGIGLAILALPKICCAIYGIQGLVPGTLQWIQRTALGDTAAISGAGQFQLASCYSHRRVMTEKL